MDLLAGVLRSGQAQPVAEKVSTKQNVNVSGKINSFHKLNWPWYFEKDGSWFRFESQECITLELHWIMYQQSKDEKCLCENVYLGDTYVNFSNMKRTYLHKMNEDGDVLNMEDLEK